MNGQDLARVEGHDRDLALVDDGQDAQTGMGGAAGPAAGTHLR